MRRFKKSTVDDKIDQLHNLMKKNQYRENISDDSFFFFSVPTKLGKGTKSDPVHIMMTSKVLMENCQNIDKGVFEIDGTYRLTKNNYPWVVCGVVDKRGCFHPIAFMISNQETEDSFLKFFEGIAETADRMGIEFDPDFIMMDSCDASYGAAKAAFPHTTVLMCFFHVMENIKQNCRKLLDEASYADLLNDIRYIHMRKSYKEFEEVCVQFKNKWNKKKTKAVYEYVSTWLTGNYSKWQIYHNPPGFASTNSNIESFNATIKRDFSLRKRYSVYSSVNIIQQIINYYSTNKTIFHTTPKFCKKTHELGKKCAIVDKYKKQAPSVYLCRDKYIIKTKSRTCSCRYFLKHAVCSHILGFLYKYSVPENWFGRKYTNAPTDFAHNTKRGAKKKTVGRYKNSEKALSSY